MANDDMTQRERKDRVGLGGRKRHGIAARLRGYFFAGLLTVAPIGLTLWLFWVLLKFVDARITPLIPQNYNPNTYIHAVVPFEIPGVGLIVLIVALIIIGALTRMLLGRTLVRMSENLVNRMPVVRSVYGATKQIVETVLKSQSDAFRQVVLFEYPRRGSWAIGFVTGQTKGEVQNLTGDDVVNVFLPDHAEPDVGVSAVPAAPRDYRAVDDGRGGDQDDHLRRHCDANRQAFARGAAGQAHRPGRWRHTDHFR